MKNYWTLVRRHPNPQRFLAARLLMATGACRLFTIRQHGFVLRFHPANLSSQLWIDPSGREDALAFFRDYLKPGDQVVDVGANIGDTVLAAAVQVGAAGHVIGIEPHPRTFGFLRDNVALNPIANVELINVAVGAVRGTARFSDDRRDDMNRVDGGTLEVPVQRLDDLIPGREPIALLKVDVEGYEKFVFAGGHDVLERAQCVHFEVSALHFARFGYSTRDVLTLLRDAGFALFRIDGRRRIAPVDLTFDTERYENLVAVRDPAEFLRRTRWSQAAAA